MYNVNQRTKLAVSFSNNMLTAGGKKCSSLVDCFSILLSIKLLDPCSIWKKNTVNLLFKLKEIHRCNKHLKFVSLTNHSDERKKSMGSKKWKQTIVWMECRPLQWNIEPAPLAPFLL